MSKVGQLENYSRYMVPNLHMGQIPGKYSDLICVLISQTLENCCSGMDLYRHVP